MPRLIKLYETILTSSSTHTPLQSQTVSLAAVNQANRKNCCKVCQNQPLGGGVYGAQLQFNRAAII